MTSFSRFVPVSIKSFAIAALCFICSTIFFVATESTASAQEPLQIDSVSLYGLSVNGTTTLEVRGKGLDDSLRLLLPFNTQQKLKLHSPNHAEIEVQLGDVAPQIVWGGFQVNAQVTGVRRWAIDALPNVVFSEKMEQLPVACSGFLSGNQVLRTTVELNEGEFFTVDLQARRIGATFQPLVRVLDEKNRQLTSSGPILSLDGDAVCRLRVPKSGKYTITLQDLTFAAPAGPFRLRMARTADEKLASVSRVAVEQPKLTENSVFSYWAFPDHRSLAPIDFALTASPASNAVALPRSVQAAWPRYDIAELAIEDIPSVGKILRVPSLPAIVSGRLQKRDTVRLGVACGAGKPLDAEVWATRIGSNCDSRVSIHAMDNRMLASGDDHPGTVDARARFGGDANIKDVVVTVDSLIPIANSGESFELVLTQPAVDPVGVELVTSQLFVRPGSLGILDVKLIRNGMNLPVELIAVPFGDHVPGFQSQPSVMVPENHDRALVPVMLGKDSPGTQWISVLARFPNNDQARWVQAVVPGRNVMATGAAEHIISVTTQPINFEATSAWKEGIGEPYEFVAGMSYDLPVQWNWPALSDEQKQWIVKAEVVTTQNIPRINSQDGNSPIDYRKALQVGRLSAETKNPVIVPVGDPNAPTAASHGESRVGEEGALRIVVPADAADDLFQWSVHSTLVNAEGKTQGAPWATKPILGRIVAPISLKLEKEVPNPWNWSKDEAQNVVNVQVESRPGITGTAQILWQGFPQGINTTPVDVVLAGDTKVLSIKLPDLSQQVPGTKLDGLKLVIQWKPTVEGSSGMFTSPPLALPSLNFP